MVDVGEPSAWPFGKFSFTCWILFSPPAINYFGVECENYYIFIIVHNDCFEAFRLEGINRASRNVGSNLD